MKQRQKDKPQKQQDMKKSIKYISYTAIVVAAIVAILFSGGNSVLTGSATADLSGVSAQSTASDANAPLGTYSISPDFAVKTGFTLGTYEEVRIDARKLLDDVKSKECTKENLGDCITDSMQKLELMQKGWSQDCGSPAERFFYDFVEFYTSCYNSENTDCICKYDFGANKYDDGSYSLTLDEVSGSTILESNIATSIELPEMNLKAYHYPLLLGGLKELSGQQKITAEYDGGKFDDSEIVITDKDGKNDDYDADQVFYVYKSAATGSGAFMATVFGSSSDFLAGKNECTLNKDRTHNFCVDKGEKVTVYVPSNDGSGGNTLQKDVVYKFALYFSEKAASSAAAQQIP
jgi:hypothetical protein